MTNAQKAQEIAKVHEVHYDRIHGETSNDECFLSALEMAGWKEQQMIEKACEWLKENIHDYYTTGDGGDEFEGWFDDMFEDFKEAMEE